MRRAIIFVSAVVVSLGLYVVLDLALAQVCGAVCADVWKREHREKFRITDEIYHHTLAPGVSVVDQWGDRHYPLATNDLGFRDSQPRHIQLRHEGKRLLFIGDSFTEGQGVTWPESFVGRVEAALKNRNVEVLNAGVSSYAPANYFTKVRHFIAERGLVVDHVFVFVDISDIESSVDEYLVTDQHRAVGRFDPPKPDPFYFRRANEWLKRNSITVAFFYKLRDFVVYRMKRREVGNSFVLGSAKDERNLLMKATEHNAGSEWCFLDEAKLAHHRYDVRAGITFAREHMTLLHEFLAGRGIGLTVAIYPWPANIIDGTRGERCELVWQSWARERGVDLIDFFDLFMVQPEPVSVIRRFFIPGDVHWNPEGHRFVADVLLDHIRRKKLIDVAD